MNPVHRLLPAYARLNEAQAQHLSYAPEGYTVQVKPPGHSSIPATLGRFVRGVLEFQTKWFGTRNTSPTIAYEIRRSISDEMTLQYWVPTKRLERKVRTQLTNEIPDISFEPGHSGLPVAQGDSIGGAILTTGRRDWYPIETEFDHPPTNSLVSTLHRDAMPDTRIVLQILLKPVCGRPVRSWWRKQRTYQQIGYLRKTKEGLWNSRKPTLRERRQARAIERKAGIPRFYTSIRVLVIGAGSSTRNRLKEVTGGLNVYQDPDTGQYLEQITVRSPLSSRIVRFASAVNNRRFGRWHRRFQVSIPEVAGLVAIPDKSQRNIATAKP